MNRSMLSSILIDHFRKYMQPRFCQDRSKYKPHQGGRERARRRGDLRRQRMDAMNAGPFSV